MLRSIGKGLCSFRQEGAFLDYTVEVEDKEFKVHKLILASASDYFKALLRVGLVESEADRVRLKGQSSAAVSTMIEYIYTGELNATECSTEELLACAMYLQIPEAIEVCCGLLRDKVDETNCLDILSIFKAHNLEEGIEHTICYLKSNFDEVWKGYELDRMSLDKLTLFLECWGKSEWQLFHAIKEWVEVDVDNRNQHMDKLMTHVRFALMPPKELRGVKKMAIYKNSDDPWCTLVTEAEEYHKLPIHLKVVHESEQSRVRAAPTPVCFIARKESRGVFHAVKGTTWVEEKALKHPQVGFKPSVSIEVNNFFVAGKDSDWHVFDPRTKKWSAIAKMLEPRIGPVVHCKKHLYVMGGSAMGAHQRYSTDSIEQYDFETNKWSTVPSKMPAIIVQSSACAINGSIYVTGGREQMEEMHYWDPVFSTRMDCFDPATNTWSSKAQLRETFTFREFSLHVMELWKEEVMVILGNGFYMRYYSPSTDQWSMCDLLEGTPSSILLYNRDSRLLTAGNTLFLLDHLYETKDVPGGLNSDRLDLDGRTYGACEMWTTCQKGKHTIQKKLGYFPIFDDGESDYRREFFLAILAIPPHSDDEN